MKFRYTIALAMIVSVSSAPLRAEEPKDIKTDKEKLSYSIGYQSGLGFQQRAADIDVDVFMRALKDAINGQKPALSYEQMQTALQKYRQEALKQRAAKAQTNMKAGEAFLDKNKSQSGVRTLPSGLLYRILKEGQGKRPKPTDTVVVHYRGTLIDGTEFDSSYKRGQPATFPVHGVIKGWQEILPLMKEGAKWNVVVPAALAYGERGASPRIGPNETLIFDIDLVSIK